MPSQLKTHFRKMHQMSMELQSDSIKSVIHRDHAGMFQCPACVYNSSFPQHLSQHYKNKHCKSNASAETVQDQADSDELLYILPIPADHVSVDSRKIMFYSPEHRVLICSRCNIGVRPHLAISHLQKHIDITSKQEISESLNGLDLATGADLNSYESKSNAIHKPIPGVPIMKGLSCSICFYKCVKTSAMKKHFSLHNDCNDAVTEECFVQRLFDSGKRCYYQVDFQAPEFIDQSLSDIQGKFQHVQYKPTDAPINDERLLPTMLQQLHWHEHLDMMDKDISQIRGVIQDLDQHVYFEKIKSWVEFYIQTSYKFFGLNFTWEIPIAEADPNVQGRSGLHRLQTSTQHYCDVLSQLIVMIIQDIESDEISWTYSSNITSSIENLKQNLSQENVPTNERLYGIHQVLEACTRQDPIAGIIEPFKYCAITRYIMFTSLTVTAADLDVPIFKEPAVITSVIAKFQYWSRVCVLMSLYGTKWVPGTARLRYSDPSLAYSQRLSKHVKFGSDTVFNRLVEMMRVLSTQGNRCIMMNKISWTSDDYTSLVTYDGVQVSIDDMRRLATDVIARAEHLLYSELLMGMNLDNAFKIIESSQLKDLPDQVTSFLDLEDNGFKSLEQ
jgi:Orsellinic acid/F9775 biosynthesis cluster protein D